jgi:hypothetical protein
MPKENPGKMSVPEFGHFMVNLFAHIISVNYLEPFKVVVRPGGKVEYSQMTAFLQEHLFDTYPSCVTGLGQIVRTAGESALGDKWKPNRINEVEISAKDFIGLVASACQSHVRT